MLSTVTYAPDFIKRPADVFTRLWETLAWERRGSTPRREYYCNEAGVPYTYGVGAGVRTYPPLPWTPEILTIKDAVEAELGCRLEVCFVNGYENSRDHLGWHADDSPSMDDGRPIAIVSLGAEREIWFRENFDPKCGACNGSGRYDHNGSPRCSACEGTGKESPPEPTKLLLQTGSLCVMAPGMQDTHKHRIPKAGRECGPRISLTFRGFVR